MYVYVNGVQLACNAFCTFANFAVFNANWCFRSYSDFYQLFSTVI